MVQLRFATTALVASLVLTSGAASFRTRPLEWDDVPLAIQQRLSATGLTAATFSPTLASRHAATLARVREGDLDAAIYYALQSTAFTSLTPVEPALSARALVESLDDEMRRRFLAGETVPVSRIPATARARLDALAATHTAAPPFSRLAYFREILRSDVPRAGDQPGFLHAQYVRAMRFLYQKEFVAQRSGGAGAVATLYRERGLSTDTAVEAGYLVHLGLATIEAVEPERRIRRVLIIGPGLDLAPRTGLLEAGAPESYQPYAVADALLALGLARLDDLVIVGADVNPRVVERLENAGTRQLALTLVSGVGDRDGVALEGDYRQYFDGIGGAIGTVLPAPRLPSRYDGHLRKALRVRQDVVRTITGVSLDIATERLDAEPFDLIIATNVLPYLDDTLLTTALANLATMLGPGGLFLHNETRPLLFDVTAALGLPMQHARTATLATVRGAPPLADAVWLHARARAPAR